MLSGAMQLDSDDDCSDSGAQIGVLRQVCSE